MDLDGLHDHCGWTFGSDGEFARAVEQFVAAGVASGAKCVVVARRDALAALTAQLDRAGSRSAELWPLEEWYEHDEPVRADETVALYEGATLRALDAGFTGLRVAADITSLVASHEQRAAFIAYEARADELMRAHPMSAVCALDRRVLDAATVTALAAVHPARQTGSSPFSCRIDRSARTVRLDGELDHFQSDAVRATLLGASLLDRAGTTWIDLSELRFVDHGTLLAVESLAREHAHRFVLVHAGSVVRRLVEMLELTHVAVATS